LPNERDSIDRSDVGASVARAFVRDGSLRFHVLSEKVFYARAANIVGALRRKLEMVCAAIVRSQDDVPPRSWTVLS